MGELDEQRLLWCLLPEFDIQLARPRSQRSVRKRFASAVVPEAVRPYASSRVREAMGGLVVTRSPNEERAVAPLFSSTPEGRRSLPGLAGSNAYGGVVRRAKRRIDDFLDRADRTELRASWRHAANATAHELRRLEGVDLSGYAFVLVARQTHPLLRALILRAEQQGVPVVYVPHSPLTDFQVDLPVSLAAMRGEAELEHIASTTGADPSRLTVIGNPASDVTRCAPPALSGPPVFAVSPDPEPLLRRMFALLGDAGLEGAVVAPHPRSDPVMLERLMPSTWSLGRVGHTLDLLRGGPRFVVQASSGVAWESAALGIPTADIRLGDQAPVYPFLRDERAFPALRSPDDVREFIAGAETADRGGLRQLALWWCASDGPESGRRMRDLVAAPFQAGPRIVDAWAPGGVLRDASPLAAL